MIDNNKVLLYKLINYHTKHNN